jgi:succinyl-CoA synthetase alpha subunit
MSILVTPQTRLLVQGITGAFGARHAQLSIDYGTQVVAGVTPGKGGQIFEHRGVKVPIFDTVAEAVRETKATASGQPATCLSQCPASELASEISTILL